MGSLNDFLLLLDSYLGSSVLFPYLLLGTGVFFTLYLKFPQIRYFKHAWSVVTGKHDKKGAAGDTSHFQALTTALSGTVGTGNIGGVALAISIGGPAALFWMWATAFFGMTTKFVEVTLSHKYRVKTEDGTMAGGPMYYMDRRLNMKWLAVLFAISTVICSFGTGNMPQINNIAQGMEATFGIDPLITGLVLAVFLAMVIIGGIKRIASITSRIVPVMAFIYLVGATSVIFYNIDNIGPSFISIFSHAFTGSAATGGFLGAAFSYAFTKGVGRGLYSNEAGQGSAAIAHAAAKTDEPVSEGMVSILEPFIDTIIICTVTGLVILSSGVWQQKFDTSFEQSNMIYLNGDYSDKREADHTVLYAVVNNEKGADQHFYSGTLSVNAGVAVGNKVTLLHARSVAEDVTYTVGDNRPFTGMINIQDGKMVDTDIDVRGKSLVHSAELTTIAFKQGYFGEWGQYIVSIGLLLFAFSTTIAWSYYGDRAVTYLLGSRFVMPYRAVFILAFIWAAVADTQLVWNLANVAIVIMTLPNLLGILLLRKEMKDTVAEYWEKMKKN